MADIAEAASISKGLIYRCFDSKAEILFSYLDFLYACLDEIKAMPSAKDAIREFGRRFLSAPDENCYSHPLQVYVIVFVKGELSDADSEKYKVFNSQFYAGCCHFII